MPDPKIHIEYWTRSDPKPKPITWGYGVDQDVPEAVEGLEGFGDRVRDLWEIAGSCFAVDRKVKRPDVRGWRAKPPDEWSRPIGIKIPVRDHLWWKTKGHRVERLLNWLTADIWTLEFTPRPHGRGSTQGSLPLDPRITALFSGGLDSIAGLVTEMSARSTEKFRTVSVKTNSHMHAVQKNCLKAVNRHAPHHVESWFFRLNLMGEESRDDTARTRGFVFLSAGVATAIAHGEDGLRVYENGTGALNLACSHGQVGAQAARPVHPKTLRLMEQLASAVADRPFRIENPCATRTKTELVRGVPDTYDDALESSVSCDTGFSHRSEFGAHCDGCTSCVLRRQALAAAGRQHLLTSTRRRTPKAKEMHEAAMRWQVARIRHALKGGPSWKRMVREFPDIVCVPGAFHPERQAELMDLFRRYADEWAVPAVTDALGE